MSRNTVQRPVASLLAHSANANELLPHLHQHALDVTGGICSLLFRHNPRTGDLQATSGFALDSLRTDPWLPGPEEAALVAEAFTRHAPTLVADTGRQAPELAARLCSRAALLMPLVRGGERVGLLAIGFETPPSASSARAARSATRSSRPSSSCTCGRPTNCSATSASCSTSSPAASRRR